MDAAKQLYDELITLRDNLRTIELSATGREPRICSDESVLEMAERIPTNNDDLRMIRGIGVTFIEKYGDSFLDITRRYARATANGIGISERSSGVLRELEKKLINISRGNRLLYTPRLSKSRTFDLTDTSVPDPLDIVFMDKEHVLCDSAEGAHDAERHRRLNLIAREVSREYREKGSLDLYVAYPFAIGRLLDDDFPIRAPLVLFPVTIRKDATTLSIRADTSRDTLYNNTLVLAHMRFGGCRGPLPDSSVEDPDRRSFIEDTRGFYRENGIDITDDDPMLHPFTEYGTDGFPRFEPGELHLDNSMVLGRFPVYSGSIQRDFDRLISKREINMILDDLISPSGDVPVAEPLTASEFRDRGLTVHENGLTYINALNSAQEHVISAMDKLDELVVQGPPGTGKSQVITGLITTAVNAGKTVILVSEKKTALDVVHSRLGRLSDYTMMIDDITDKDLFYSQMQRMFTLDGPADEPADLDPISDEIEKNLEGLNRIADGMYSPDSFGIEPYRMYSLVKKVDLDDPDESERYRTLKDNISSSLARISYGELRSAYERFNDRSLSSSLKGYYRCLDEVPWFSLLKPGLTEFSIHRMEAELSGLRMESDDWKSKNFLSRVFGKSKISRDATVILSKYFTKYGERNLNEAINDPAGMAESLGSYDVFASYASTYNGLSRVEQTYGENLISINTKMPGTFDMSNDELFAFIMKGHLQDFETANRALIQDIRDFEDIRMKVDGLISEKRSATRDRVGCILGNSLLAVTGSKMRDEIVRVIESKRRWSVRKFISRFGLDLFRGIRIWLMTPEAVSELIPLEMGLFDMLIFDEASQMYVEKGIPSIYRAKKVVVAGDQKQLRPSCLYSGRTVCDDDDDDNVAAPDEESLLDLARSRYASVLLNFHYRSRYEELIAFSNYAFYNGRLYVSPNVDVPERPPIEVHRINDAVWEDKTNRKEAEAVVSLLRHILATKAENETVGIITFNLTQRDLICDLIEEECLRDRVFGDRVRNESERKENGEDIGLFLKNIESVQGDERDIIVFSVGYARNRDGKLMQRFGWLNNAGGENRLNVAVSRARRKVHIVTSFRPDELQVDDSKNDGPRYLKKYLEYADAVSDGDRESQKRVLDSFGNPCSAESCGGEGMFDGQIYDALRKRGYDVEKNIGIGGYRIDVAVRKGDRYVLGIECDSGLYRDASTARDRDYHRQKYLESRGWRIKRIWSIDWWNDPEKEIRDIVLAIDTES